MLSTMTERMTVQCRRYTASYHSLAKSSRSQSEKMLLLALAEWWLALAERANQGSRPHRCSAESRLATFRRKIGGFMNFDQWRDAKRSPSEWPTGSAGREIAGADLWD